MKQSSAFLLPFLGGFIFVVFVVGVFLFCSFVVLSFWFAWLGFFCPCVYIVFHCLFSHSLFAYCDFLQLLAINHTHTEVQTSPYRHM